MFHLMVLFGVCGGPQLGLGLYKILSLLGLVTIKIILIVNFSKIND